MDKLFYFSKSANKKAGKGVNEHVKNENEYKELNKITDWRKMLSNFYISPFVLDNKKWASVEHYYHSQKFKSNPKFSETFEYDSDSSYSKDAGKAKSAGGKSGKGRDYKYKNVAMDKDFYSNTDKIFKISMFSKFTQNPELMKVLLATGNAELLHGTRGTPIQRVYSLEKVKDCIRKFKDRIDLSKVRIINNKLIL